MTAVSRESLAALRALATGATPGPWAPGDWHVWARTESGNREVCGMAGHDHFPDAAYIAAADPTTVLGLIDALDSVLNLREAIYRDEIEAPEVFKRLGAALRIDPPCVTCGEPLTSGGMHNVVCPNPQPEGIPGDEVAEVDTFSWEQDEPGHGEPT